MTPRPPRGFSFAAITVAVAIALLAIAVLPLAAPATPPAAVSAEAEIESTEEELEEEEWLIELEAEEEEEEGFEGGTAGPTGLPPECVLRTAEPSVIALHSRLQLTLRYTSEAPTDVGIEYWLKGGKGSLQLDSAKRHLGRRGVLRMSRQLDQRALAKVQAAHTVLLRLDLPDAESHCKRFLTFRLASKRRQGARTIWSEPLERR
jgi:hypothetical protein